MREQHEIVDKFFLSAKDRVWDFDENGFIRSVHTERDFTAFAKEWSK